jgi:hypothetical protein
MFSGGALDIRTMRRGPPAHAQLGFRILRSVFQREVLAHDADQLLFKARWWLAPKTGSLPPPGMAPLMNNHENLGCCFARRKSLQRRAHTHFREADGGTRPAPYIPVFRDGV